MKQLFSATDREQELKDRIKQHADNLNQHFHELTEDIKQDLARPLTPLRKARDAVVAHPLRSVAVALGVGLAIAGIRAPRTRTVHVRAARIPIGSPLLGLLGRGLLFVVGALADSRPSPFRNTVKDFSPSGQGTLPADRGTNIPPSDQQYH